jgi:AcrR family transcriptional regulator
MVDNSLSKRARGRPQAFDPDEALDRAVDMFWANNYVGVDVDQIARAVNVTKPALYREFGDKATLLLKAVERYAKNYGAPMMEAFLAEPNIRKAVANFCEATINTATTEPRLGCMMASAALGQSERVAEIRSFFAQGLSATANILAERFEKEMRARRLSRKISAEVRGRALVDLMQGMLLRAKAGVPRKELLEDARSYASVVLA